MKILERIWEDVRQGENIDLYLTVSVALVLTLLNLSGVAPQSSIAPMTLAVLGLLAITSLVNRRKTEEMLRVIQAKEQILLNDFPSDFQIRMEKSKELWLLGVNLGRTAVSNFSLFEEKVKRGDKIKVLLVSPKGQALPLASKRRREPNYLRQNLALVEASLTSFSDLKKIAPDRVEIRTIDYPLSLGFVAVDPDTASGILYVSYYSFKTAGSSIPKMVFQPKDGCWYEQFREEIDNLWNDAAP